MGAARLSLIMVGAARFELATPTTPLWCATRLRYAPTVSAHHTCSSVIRKESESAAQDLKNLFKFQPQLLDNLLTLGHVRLC